MSALNEKDYGRLLRFRTELRRFLRWTEDQATAAGITPAQHQLLLAIRGHEGDRAPSIKELASYLLDRQHSVSELAARAQTAGLVRRVPDATDHRVVRLKLTAKGERKLAALAALHIEEIQRLAPVLASLGRVAAD